MIAHNIPPHEETSEHQAFLQRLVAVAEPGPNGNVVVSLAQIENIRGGVLIPLLRERAAMSDSRDAGQGIAVMNYDDDKLGKVPLARLLLDDIDIALDVDGVSRALLEADGQPVTEFFHKGYVPGSDGISGIRIDGAMRVELDAAMLAKHLPSPGVRGVFRSNGPQARQVE